MTPAQASAGAALQIRRTTADDAPAFAELMADPALFGNLLGLPYPDIGMWRARLGGIGAPGTVDLSLVALRDGRVVGSAGLFSVHASLRQRHVASLGISVARDTHRQGVGAALMRALIDYADDWAQVLRIELTVFTDNAPAIALYEKFGFELEGRHRCDTLRAGRYVDSFSMARLHPDPPQLAGDA